MVLVIFFRMCGDVFLDQWFQQFQHVPAPSNGMKVDLSHHTKSMEDDEDETSLKPATMRSLGWWNTV